MRKPLLLLLLVLVSLPVFTQPGPRRGGGPRELILPPRWWHDPYVTERVTLTAAQTQELDRLAAVEREGIERAERDIANAERELRATLDAPKPVVDRIIAAGNRVAMLRDQMLRRHFAMLARQRAVLTLAQWTALQQQLQERRHR